MKTAKYRSLGVDVNLSVPESVEEFDQNAKRAGACLEEAVNNCVYRGSLAEFRDSFTEAVAKQYEIARKTKPTGKKNAAGEDLEVYSETEGDFIERVCAEKGIEAESLQPIADGIASGIVFDAAARERKPAGPKKLPALYLNTAAQCIANGKQDAVVSMVLRDLQKTVTLTGDGAKDTETLGWAIREHRMWKEKQQLAEYAV